MAYIGIGATPTWVNGLVQLLVALFIFIIVLVLAYFAARITGGFQANMNRRSNIHIIETYRITNNKYIQIVQIGNRYVALGVSKDNIEVLIELDETDLAVESLDIQNKGSFKDILSQFQFEKKDKKDEK